MSEKIVPSDDLPPLEIISFLVSGDDGALTPDTFDIRMATGKWCKARTIGHPECSPVGTESLGCPWPSEMLTVCISVCPRDSCRR